MGFRLLAVAAKHKALALDLVKSKPPVQIPSHETES